MKRKTTNSFLALLIAVSSFPPAQASAQDDAYDVVIYGATSAGIAAAVQVTRMGGSVIVLEPTSRIGGLTTGGLGQTDIGNKAAIGGISREFYQRVRRHYELKSSWRWQQKTEYRSGGQSRSASREDTMWTFEPSVALQIMHDFIVENEIIIKYQQLLDRGQRCVIKDGARIVGFRVNDGHAVYGRTFIDATYEGDLLAEAGVSWTVGREANADYSETLSGVQTRRAIHHQFVKGVDPYITPGDPSSGLLPGIDATGPGEEGAKDHRVQAYCFRMCLTDHPENRLPFTKPRDYREVNYELLFRNFEAGAKTIPWSNSAMPNRKTDVNNNKGFSTDYIGRNYNYPTAGYDERARIVADHLRYQQGLMWTLANHPRVPDWVRQEISRWGTCKDEFERADGWQQQLYIREARRMIGDYVMTQHNCQGRDVAAKPVGLAAYTMDSHNVQRHIGEDGFVHNEGDVQVGGFSPYPIDYGSIVAKQTECSNLLVPVCLSATHLAFGSIRMEPVFMVLGQSAATAAMQSIQQNVDVQDVDYDTLRERLEDDRQVLIWTGPKKTTAVGIAPESLPGIVIDDESAERTGFDSSSTSAGPFIGIGYRHDGNDGKGRQKAVFTATITKAGKYAVRLAYSPFSNRSTNVPLTVTHSDGDAKFIVNQRNRPAQEPFVAVAELTLTEGKVSVTVTNDGTNGYVIIDAVQLLPLD
ncbi:MAG: FAD-dependent oxidoreductase [Fuerstiella sp.]|nr:FAD-dependent oxidoreductase [Fuerstiella sp.]